MESEKQYGRRRMVKKTALIEKTEKATQTEKSEPVKAKENQVKTAKDRTAEKTTSNARSLHEKPHRTQSRSPGRYDKTKSDKDSRSGIQKRYVKKSDTENISRKQKTDAVKLSVIIPAYNEELNIASLLEQFNQLFSKLPYRAEMIFVDDGSTDRTLIRARERQIKYSWLKILSHRINRGLTAALETGFKKSSGKLLCFYPSDLQYHANEIPKMVSKIDSGIDIVTGWKQGGYGLKSVSSFIYNLLSRKLFNIKVHDLNSIKVFKKEIIDYFNYHKGWHRYMVVMAAREGFKIDEVRVKLYPRQSGKSKFGFWRLPAGFLDMLSVKFQLSFTGKPLLFFGSAGLISVGLGFLTGLVALYFRFVQNTGYRPLLYMVSLLIVSGLMLFTIGFLAELIVSIKEDINKRRNDP